MAKEKTLDRYIKRSITLLRAAEGEALESAAIINKVHDAIINQVQTVFKTPPTRKKVDLLKKQIDSKLASFYSHDWPKELSEAQTEIIAKEIIWNQATLATQTGSSIIVLPSADIVKRAAKKTYQGFRFTTWTKRAFGAESTAIDKALSEGFVKGKNIEQMTRDVKQIIGRSGRDIKTITRSSFMHNAREAKQSVYKLNPKIVTGRIWVSTLDSSTTPLICGVRDGKFYDNDLEPIGHDLPWEGGPGAIHWNCRSTDAPTLPGERPVGDRPSVGPGANYTSGDNLTNRGTVRRPSKSSREKGIHKAQLRTNRTGYEGWLREQSKKNIDFASDILGKQNARDFRDGKVSLFELGLESPVARPLNRKLI